MTQQIKDEIEVDGVPYEITRPWFKKIYDGSRIELSGSICTACYGGMAFRFKVVEHRVILESVFCCPDTRDTVLLHEQGDGQLDWDDYQPVNGEVSFSGTIRGRAKRKRIKIVVEDGTVLEMVKRGT